MTHDLGTKLLFRQDNGEALVEVVSTNPIQLQSGQVLNSAVRVRVVEICKEFQGMPLRNGYEVVIYDREERGAKWSLEGVEEKPAEQLGLGLLLPLPD